MIAFVEGPVCLDKGFFSTFGLFCWKVNHPASSIIKLRIRGLYRFHRAYCHQSILMETRQEFYVWHWNWSKLKFILSLKWTLTLSRIRTWFPFILPIWIMYLSIPLIPRCCICSIRNTQRLRVYNKMKDNKFWLRLLSLHLLSFYHNWTQ